MTTIAKDVSSPRHALDNVIFTITGLPSNDATAYDATKYPTEPAVKYHLFFDAPGATSQYDMTSQVFTPDANGTYVHAPVAFPVAGTWNVVVRDAADSDIATLSVVVS